LATGEITARHPRLVGSEALAMVYAQSEPQIVSYGRPVQHGPFENSSQAKQALADARYRDSENRRSNIEASIVRQPGLQGR
jgi:hypothetical protein